MEQKLDVENVAIVVIVVSVVLLVLLSLFTFGFCIPVIEDYKTQLDIFKDKGCEVSYEEYMERRELYDGSR